LSQTGAVIGDVRQQPTPEVLRATLLILFSACCFGSIAIFVSVATRAGARLVDVLAWRYLLGGLALRMLSGGFGAGRVPPKRALALLVLAGGGQALVAGLSLSALNYVSVSTVTFLFYSYPAWVALIAAMRGTEPLTGQRVAALVLSLAGIAVMVGMPGAGGLNPIGVTLALVAAFLYALYIPMMGRFSESLSPAVTSSYACAGAAMIYAAAAVMGGGPVFAMAPVAWAMIGLLAIVSTAIAFLAFLRGLAVIGPVRTAIVSTIEPFWASIFASVALGQELSPRALGGGVLIAAAVVILNARPTGTGRATA
jgi:drug/metabolite transporter (DMT)-like permease